MPKSAIDEIKELKAQLQSKREAAATEALAKAREGVTVLRELEIDDDTILKGLGFRGRTPKAPNASNIRPQRPTAERAPVMSRARYVTFKQTLPTMEDRTGARQRRSRLPRRSFRKRG
jgi:hypothetical protein